MLEPGTLWEAVQQRTQSALQTGALQPIPTHYEFVEQNGVHFIVRILANLDRKEVATQQQRASAKTTGKDFNPFLPYEPDLFVADLSDTHLCLLNKFNVIDHHLLIVTRAFEAQESPLTLADFQATWACLVDMPGLVFYNAGEQAGASQRHKHVQLVPLPLVPEASPLPIASVLATVSPQSSMAQVPFFPFDHGIIRFDDLSGSTPQDAAAIAFEAYTRLIHSLRLQDNTTSFTKPYNLLMTSEWMLVVPRSHEKYESISVNSLGFAGALFVRDRQQMSLLKQVSPLTLLQNVAMPLHADS